MASVRSVTVAYRGDEPATTGRSDRTRSSVPALPTTADETRGTTNLATIPRAGNISTDTRAG